MNERNPYRVEPERAGDDAGVAFLGGVIVGVLATLLLVSGIYAWWEPRPTPLSEAALQQAVDIAQTRQALERSERQLEDLRVALERMRLEQREDQP